MEIGIFTSSQENDDGVPISFFGMSDAQILDALYKAAVAIAGPGMDCFDPPAGMKVRKVGAVTVAGVDDESVYVIQADDEAAKPEGGRVPPGSNGTWAIQTLIFSKDEFTLEEARKWVTDHDGFGDYGVDETETSYRFRQYDPQFFSEYRTITVDTGISAAYGKIDKDTERSTDEGQKSLTDSIKRWEAVHAVNKGIMAAGLRILTETATINKAEDGAEERFVMSLVLEPNDGEGDAPLKPDTQGDIYSAEDIRKAAHAWMENYGAIDLHHSWKALGKDKVRVLECYIAPVAFTLGEGDKAYDIIKGTWMLGVRVADDDLWADVKAGELGAYSIGGTAIREEVD